MSAPDGPQERQIADLVVACPSTFDAFDGRQCELAEGHEDLHWAGMMMWGTYERALETEVEWNPLPPSEEGRTDG